MEKEQRRSEDGSTLRNCSCRIQREFDWTIRVRNLRRRASTSNQPRNIHLQYKPESKTYASRRRYRTRVRYDAWPKKKEKGAYLASSRPRIALHFCRRCTSSPLGGKVPVITDVKEKSNASRGKPYM